MTRSMLSTSIAAGLCILSLKMTGCVIHTGQFGNWNQAKFERTTTQQAPLGTNTTIDAESSYGAITITGAETDKFDVAATITGYAPTEEEAQELAEQTQIRLESVGDTLRVRADTPTTRSKRGVSVSYAITAPKRINVKCESSFGSLKVAGVEGTVSGKSDNGSVEARDIQGPVNLRSSFGSITCANVVGRMTDLKSSNGSITIEDLKGPAKAETSFGSITCRNFSDGDFHLRSDNGRVSLTHGSAGECDASSSFGAIDCRDLKGRIVKLSSDNGSVELADVDASTLGLATSFGTIRAQQITTTDLTARSGNGSVNIACSESCPADLKAEVRSDFGSVEFTAPPQFAGRVHLSTSFGAVRTARPVAMSGEIDKKSISGMIGQGAGSIRLSSANGSVELK